MTSTRSASSVRGHPRRSLLTGLVAAATARGAYAAASARPPGGEQLWARTNHRGEPVTLLEGPAVAAGMVAAAVSATGVPRRERAAAALAAVGAGAFGGYDDLVGSGDRRGFRGHLGALCHGELTTGAVKLGGIGTAGIASAAMLGGPPVDVAINAGLIAGSANLLNLFDLRPGRAIKVALAAAALLGAPARPMAAAAAGGSAALLREDLGERAMLGDAGANAVGAVLGAVAAASLPRAARLALLGAIAGLTAASEVVSFTKVIERTPPLRWIDMLGRKPPLRPAAPRSTQDKPAAPVPPTADAPSGATPPSGVTGSGSRLASNGQAPATAGDAATPRPPTTT